MNINNRLLLTSGKCDAHCTVKIKALAGRSGAFLPKKLRIDVTDGINLVNITLTNISIMGVNQFESDTRKICTSYFNKFQDIDFMCFGSSEKQGMLFEFHNPLVTNVKIYISMLGQCNSVSDLNVK